MEKLNTILLDLYHKGGVMTIPLFICSLLMVAVIVERLLALRKKSLFPAQELENLRAAVAAHPDQFIQIPINTTHPIGRILGRAISIMPMSPVRFKEIVQDQARQELHVLQRGLVILEILVGIGPLLGLLGTILGMIVIFANISLEGVGRAQALGEGISEALLTTVLGLIVAIPSLIAYNLFSRKVETLGLLIEQEITFFYHKLYPNDEAL